MHLLHHRFDTSDWSPVEEIIHNNNITVLAVYENAGEIGCNVR